LRGLERCPNDALRRIEAANVVAHGLCGLKRGRRVKFRPRPDALDLAPRPLKSTGEVCELLEETINLVRRGSLDVRAANSIGVLAGIHLKALAQRVEARETDS
jgi:hypothetical protein